MIMQVNCCMMNDCLCAEFQKAWKRLLVENRQDHPSDLFQFCSIPPTLMFHCVSASQSNTQGTCALLCRTVLEIKAKTAFRPLKTGSDLWCWLGRKCLPHQKILPQYFAQVLFLVTVTSAPRCDKTSYCMHYCAACHVCIIQSHDTTTKCTSEGKHHPTVCALASPA